MVNESLPPIITERLDSVALVRFNRPADRNPLSLATLLELNRITTALFSGQSVKAVIFTGSEDVFASGANIRELAELKPTSALQFSQLGQRIFQRIADAQQLTIAAINGYCMGGAMDLALVCDIRVASKDAIFAHPGAQLGIVTGWGGTQRLPRIIKKGRALELLLTARRMTAVEALNVGLVSRVSDSPLDTALSIARNSLSLLKSR